MSTIASALTAVHQQIREAAQRSNRSPESIQLLAVSKTRSVTEVLTAIQWGQWRFGENYLQEALPKIQAFADRHPPIEWHFIGPIQTNKTRALAEHFSWIHSLTSLKQAQRLNEQRPISLPPLNVCIQVNVSEEPQKSGIHLLELTEFAQAVVQFPRLRLRGLMTIPAYSEEFTQQCRPFRMLYQAYRQLQDRGLSLDTLSMGMTNDLTAAIAEGSTLIRVGTGIFGVRD